MKYSSGLFPMRAIPIAGWIFALTIASTPMLAPLHDGSSSGARRKRRRR
jgi:hypothetical protein